MTGTLILAGTPLGNPGDASSRLREALISADLVAAEDTRKLRRLLDDLGLSRSGPTISYYEGVEEARWPRLAEVLTSGGTVLLTTDAGMPSVSDPGFRAAQAAIEAGFDVRVLPGPSAVTSALAVSGLPSNRFCFEGFLPRKAGERASRLGELADEPRTQILFEAPRRLGATLIDLVAAFGPDRPAVLCRELTKTYEEIVRGTLGELAAWATGEVRGEITLVIAGASSAPANDLDAGALAAEVAYAESSGVPRKDAISLVAALHQIPKRLVYGAVLAGRD